MKLAVVCCTFARPNLLAHAIGSFLHQDYSPELREMIILDDNGQYKNQSGDGWHLVSLPRRFRTIGEKRNAAAAMASPDVDAYVVWDDDDLYLPHAISSHARALRQAPWSLPSNVWLEDPRGKLALQPTQGLFHSGWAYTREAFRRADGYPFMQSGQDQGLAARFRRLGIESADPVAEKTPFLIYRWSLSGSWHLSALNKEHGYDRLADQCHRGPPIEKVSPQWPPQYQYLLDEDSIS